MEIIADILLVAGALGAGFYCYILGRRLNKFNDLEKGVGGAVAVLSQQVDDLNKTLTAAQNSASTSAETLTALVARAEDTSRQLKLQMAALHDLPDPTSKREKPIEQASEKPAEFLAPTSAEPMFTRRRSAGGAA